LEQAKSSKVTRKQETSNEKSKFTTLFGVTEDRIVAPVLLDIPNIVLPEVIPFAPKSVATKLKKYRTSFVDCFRYPVDGKLRGHVDMLPGYALIVSLGNDAVFWYQEPSKMSSKLMKTEADNERKEKQQIVVKSGDAILFDAGMTANILHGIDHITDTTCPSHIIDFAEDCRFCIQYRQYPN